MKKGQELYRYEHGFLYVDGTVGKPMLIKLICVKETPKGGWVKNEYTSRRYVANEGRKRYCRETEAEALEDYGIRLKKRIGHLERQLGETNKHLWKWNEYLNDFNNDKER